MHPLYSRADTRCERRAHTLDGSRRIWMLGDGAVRRGEVARGHERRCSTDLCGGARVRVSKCVAGSRPQWLAFADDSLVVHYGEFVALLTQLLDALLDQESIFYRPRGETVMMLFKATNPPAALAFTLWHNGITQFFWRC